jgi:serine/threonine protein kinase/formylglycine-generating enzyme required for sulfatase activity
LIDELFSQNIASSAKPSLLSTRFPMGDARPAAEEPIPANIGRYVVRRIINSGAFATVYLAYDETLDRQVAIKVPHRHRISKPQDVESYLSEARIIARLKHPHIVPAHDAGQMDDGRCFVVCDFIEGSDLAGHMAQGRPSSRESAELVATIAVALEESHRHGIVHRDVKPSNILLDSQGNAFVADFGLALKEEDFGDPRWQGLTPAYASPEQARREGHLVDGRSDVFSLGVVLYELLTGERPFQGEDTADLLELIASLTVEARPPRQLDASIPQELERICLKALAKRASDRYATALELADDLRHFLTAAKEASETTTRKLDAETADGDGRHGSLTYSISSRIVPKGLRSFDEDDAEFFLELLPGPTDRDGLPDSIRFWKTRIDQTQPDRRFRVGLVYGPSGCGKSSLVKAGLLPRLASHVVTMYVESTADQTESRLTAALHRQCPDLASDLPLPEMLATLRRGQGLQPGQKVVIVLDQFEQWLHARREDAKPELVEALRQCDGSRVQCIVLVRDDFWMAVTRFMNDLEIPLIEGVNSKAVDLFPLRHAQEVLTKFGRAYGNLADPLTPVQREFVSQAVPGLAEAGKVVCIRLALFAEMMKDKPWTPACLKKVGGIQGVGVTFLEETFSAATAPPEHRHHQQAARLVLKALLPESGTHIKGPLRSYEELLEISGYSHRPADFSDLMRILDPELRLITPAEKDEGGRMKDEVESQASVSSLILHPSSFRHFQLTHDYLVSTLREWLTRKQQETRRGRTQLLLAERAATWNAKSENRNLPSWWEYMTIRLLVGRRQWNSTERAMMHRAAVTHGTHASILLTLLVIAIVTLWHAVQSNNHARAGSLVKAVLTASPEALPYAIDDLTPLQIHATRLLRQQLSDQNLSPSRRLHAACALARLGDVDHKYLVDAIPGARFSECPNIVAALRQSLDKSVSVIQSEASAAHAQRDWKHKARLAIVALHLDHPQLAADMVQINDRPDPIQRTVFIHIFASWHGNLAELAQQLHESKDAPLRSAVCLAVGSIPEEDTNDEVRQAWRAVWENWYVHQADAVTHSAAGWALRKWKLALPEIGKSGRTLNEQDWIVTPMGLTLIRIPPGTFVRQEKDGRKQKVTITREFLLSDREVNSPELFRRFIDDAKYDGEKPPDWETEAKRMGFTDAHPVCPVSWYDAVMFCNWLSRQEGRTPCYEKSGAKDERGYEEWKIVPAANGYRLPTEAEWEYACRAGTRTVFTCGDDEAYLSAYAVFSTHSPEPVATKLCNGWGLFDMHGNVWEWCHDWYGDYPVDKAVVDPAGPPQGAERVGRGGRFEAPARWCRSVDRAWTYPSNRILAFGLRVAIAP